MDSLKKELWNNNLAKKRKKTQQIELRQAPRVQETSEKNRDFGGGFLYYSWYYLWYYFFGVIMCVTNTRWAPVCVYLEEP
jgi:hypothetical protein